MLGFGTLAKKVFGTPNDRKVKATRPFIEKINALEADFIALTDEGLVQKTAELTERAQNGESLDALLPEAFANCREAARREHAARRVDRVLLGHAVLVPAHVGADQRVARQRGAHVGQRRPDRGLQFRQHRGIGLAIAAAVESVSFVFAAAGVDG